MEKWQPCYSSQTGGLNHEKVSNSNCLYFHFRLKQNSFQHTRGGVPFSRPVHHRFRPFSPHTWGCIDLVSMGTGEMKKRYGFIYIDRDNHGVGTLNRTKKKSFYLYKNVIESNGRILRIKAKY